MIQGFYFYLYRYLHNIALSACGASLLRFLFLIRFQVKRLFCKPNIIDVSHDDAVARLIAVHPDPSGRPDIVNLPKDPGIDLSVIIPIYNYVNLIEKNIQSILNQKTKYSFELILVDDGSTDGASDIVKKFAEEPRVKAIFQKNQGIAGARNTGLNHATGKYVMFVDCDDIADDNLIEILMETALQENHDLVMCAHNLVKERDGKVYHILPNIYPSYNLLGYSGRAKILNYAGLPWCKVYKRELFQPVRFYTGYWYEDTIIHLLIFTRCRSFKYIPKTAYQYRWYEGNFSHTQGNRINVKSIDYYWLLRRILEDYESMPDAVFDECFYTTLVKHLSVYYLRKIDGLDESIVTDLFSLGCDLFERYGKKKYKLPYMLRITEKALETRDIALWKLASTCQ